MLEEEVTQVKYIWWVMWTSRRGKARGRGRGVRDARDSVGAGSYSSHGGGGSTDPGELSHIVVNFQGRKLLQIHEQ